MFAGMFAGMDWAGTGLAAPRRATAIERVNTAIPYMPESERVAIQTAMPIIIRFSVSEMNPSGTLLEPPTQAHLS